ncbi:hypothetical protein OEZ85_011036 [Tetradesmus obliquus]|uniref:Peptidase S74 domain-containing protein n=1 Tax=Tetradesmus obliquus TaxID=3088 RepID=A0ABY8TP15_TETOB|nr:hypothetical protein OEZ85_011036 [Tetradesmus obliquus]
MFMFFTGVGLIIANELLTRHPPRVEYKYLPRELDMYLRELGQATVPYKAMETRRHQVVGAKQQAAAPRACNVNTAGVVQAATINTTGTLTSNVVKVTDDMFIADKLALGMVAGEAEPPERLYIANGNLLLACGNIELTLGNININAGNLFGASYSDLLHAPADTRDIPEHSSTLYFTQARARAALSAGMGLAFDASTGLFTANTASTSTPGVVSLADSISNNSTTHAATANAVAWVSSNANGRVSKQGDTMTGQLVCSNAGAIITAKNMSNATGENASIVVQTGGSLAGNASVVLDVAGVQGWSLGVDNSDGDKFKVLSSNTFSGNSCLVIDSSGNTGLGGCTAPTMALDVQGNIRASSNVYGVRWPDLANKPDTSGIPENAANLYFTEARARAALSAGLGLAFNASTGLFTANTASTSTPGVVSLADSISNNSTAHAATANAVAWVSSNANGRVSKQGDTMTGQLVCSNAGAIITARNMSNATGQNASIVVQTGGSLAGNASVVLDVAGVQGWSLGVDNSDGDKFKVLSSNTFSGNSRLVIDSSGNTGLGGCTAPTMALDVQGNIRASSNVYGVRWPDLANKPDTSGIPENAANLYFTEARARAALSAGLGLAFNASTGLFTANTASTSTPGVVSLADSISNNSTAHAATANAVAWVSSNANGRVSKQGDTMTGQLVCSNAGAIITAKNMSNATGQNASIVVQTGGSLAGNASVVLDVAGVQGWSLGIDNSDGDKFKVLSSNTFSGNSRLVIDSSGNTGLGGCTAPTMALDVQGNIRASSNVYGVRWPDLANKPDTSGIPENAANLYFTEARARAALSAGLGLVFNASTGLFTANTASTSTSGVVSLADSISNNSTTHAATANAVAWVSSNANGRVSKQGDTMTGQLVCSNAGAIITAKNMSNATGQNASIVVQTGGSLAGNASVVLDVAGVQGWSLGVDNSDGDKFKVLSSNTFSGNSCLVIDSSGNTGLGGCTAPTMALDVQGNIRASSNVYGVRWPDLANKPDTSGIPENAANLYFTEARSRAALSAGLGLAFNASTGLFTANTASTSTSGVVSLADSISNNSTTHAATANAVAWVSSNANGRVSKQGDTMTGQLVCSNAGAIITAKNMSNATGENASIVVQTGGSLAGNASVVLDVAGVQGWSLGVDNSDGDKFKVLSSNTFSGNSCLVIDSSGNTGLGGCTAPTMALDVQGNIRASSNVYGVRWPDLANKPDTSGIPENAANLYFTETRARAALSAGLGLAFNASTGLFTANTASTSTSGVVSLADSISNNSTTHAATANAVAWVSSNANGRVSKQGDTMTGQLVCSNADAIITARNMSNATGQHASIVVQAGGSLAGNASVVLDLAGVQGWSLGVDNSDGDKFKLLGSNNFSSGLNNFVSVDRQGNVGIGIAQTSSRLHVSGGTFKASLPAPVQSSWRDLSFEGTSLWGDACATPSEFGGTLYGTLRPVMLQNPHVVPATAGGNATIRIGRSGGISTGLFWEAGTRTDRRFCITRDGGNATGMAIDENGNMVVSGDVTAFGSLSDARLKEDVVPFDGAAALETVCALNPVHFRWRQDIANALKRGTTDDGLIAQEVAKVYPVASHAIQSLDGSTFNTVRYEKLTPLLIKSVQQLCARIGDLEHRVSRAEEAAAAAAYKTQQFL